MPITEAAIMFPSWGFCVCKFLGSSEQTLVVGGSYAHFTGLGKLKNFFRETQIFSARA